MCHRHGAPTTVDASLPLPPLSPSCGFAGGVVCMHFAVLTRTRKDRMFVTAIRFCWTMELTLTMLHRGCNRPTLLTKVVTRNVVAPTALGLGMNTPTECSLLTHQRPIQPVTAFLLYFVLLLHLDKVYVLSDTFRLGIRKRECPPLRSTLYFTPKCHNCISIRALRLASHRFVDETV